MDKLELDLNDLEVDSFETKPEQKEERGTVQGNEPPVTLDLSCVKKYTEDGSYTCEGGYSCPGGVDCP